jgi:hypothetical protein
MKVTPDDDFIGFDISDPEDRKTKQIIVAPPLQGAISDNKWLLIAAAAVVLLLVMKRKK